MQWPTNWIQETLRAAGVPVTQHAIDVLSAWFRSTPTQSWTNNPLGLDASTSGAPKALHTDYAAFASHDDFRQAFKQLAHNSPGKVIVHVLMNEGQYAAAWRAINALNLPGNKTESDYPSELLDMVEGKYRSKLQTTSAGNRRSAGSGARASAPHEAVNRAANSLAQGSESARGLQQAIAGVLRGLNSNG